MDFQNARYSFARLTWHAKLLIVSAVALVISTFLPWYADTDAYKGGDQFLGVTGPTSFMGITIVLLAGGSLYIAIQHARGRKPKLPIREGVFHLAVAVQSMLLLFLVNSVFFHPKFGVNITFKESGFGMIIAVASSITLFVAAYMQNKMERESDDEIGKLEPLIKMDSTPGLAERGRTSIKEDTPVVANPEPERRRVTPVVRGHRLEGFTMAPEKKQEVIRQRVEEKESKRQDATQQWRIDL